MRTRWKRAGLGALCGLLSAAVALGVGEVVAAFVRPAAAPVIAVGNRVIVLTPEPVKRWAIATFGTGDKAVLLTGIYVVVAVLAIAVGALAVHRLGYGLLGMAVFGAFAVYCALTANGHRGSDAVPAVIGTLAALGVLAALVRCARTNADRGAALEADSGAETWFPSRRSFVQSSVAAAALAAVTGVGGRAAQRAHFDAAPAREKLTLPRPDVAAAALPRGTDLGKSAVPWVTPNADFYRVDTALSLPQVTPQEWSLRVHGMVDREITLDYPQLLARPLVERWITLCCVSNEVGGGLVGNARFLGVRLADLLREAGVHSGADQLLFTSADAMTIGAPTAVVMDGREALLAIGMNGEPLPIAHGFPARIVVPGLYGYVSACKWVTDIEATTFRSRRAYWAAGGWAPHPEIKLESRIDTPRSGARVSVGRPVPIAGVAWDQHVGVSEVAVQVEDGPWQPARLAPVPSTDTWRQWVLSWTPPRAGAYTIRVRATDAAGNPQTTQRRRPFPSGATGLHSVVVRAQ